MQRLPLKKKISVAVRVIVHNPFEDFMFSSVFQKLRPVQRNGSHPQRLQFILQQEGFPLSDALLIKILGIAVHTMAELKLSGNHLKGSRPVLSFTEVSDHTD